jgi:hypothetical protein
VSTAHATFIIDTSCDESKCAAGTDFFIDDVNKDVTVFTGTVGGHFIGPAVTVTTTGSDVDTGAGFADIKPAKGATLPDLIFTPKNDTLFSDFSFRGQLESAGFTGTVDIKWTDSLGTTGMVSFTVLHPDADFGRFGIVSLDGETLKSVEIITPGSESFKEVKQVQFSGVSGVIPEPSTWAMMLLGFAGLGYVGYRHGRKGRSVPALP